ncbi:MAG: c-type cytochrome [Thiolinea sp.]
MASNTDETFAQYKLYTGIAIGGILLAAVLDSCTAPTKEEIAAAKEAKVAAVEAKEAAVETAAATLADNLKPIEKVEAVEKAAPAGPARGGAEVYQAACLACHASGVLNAPKLEAGAWDDRIGKGLDGLTTSAINGINSMPPRGGNPDISDEEMKNAISYMLAESGYDVTEGGNAAQAGDTASGDATQADSAAITAAVEEAKAAAEEAKAAAEEAKAAAEEAKAAAAAKPAATATEESQPAAEETKSEAAEAESNVVQSTDIDSLGKQVYSATCFTCHDVGISNSPLLTDKAGWNERIGAGIDSLYNSALNGKGAMPPKGGHSNLSMEQVKAAVDYMLDTAGVDMAADAGNATQAATTETEQPAQEAPAAEEEKAEEATQEAATEEKTEAATQEAPAEEKAEEATEATSAAAQEAPAETPAAASTWASIDGEKVYRGICFSCHDAGIAQAPVLGKATAWEARIAAGMDTLYSNSINGKGVMPAKGGNPALSDDEIKAAVDWMIAQVK